MIKRSEILKAFSFSKFAPNFFESDLLLLSKYAAGATFVIETGTGISTHYIADGARPTCNLMYSIDIMLPPEHVQVDWVQYVKGWSMTAADLPRSNDPDFLKSKYRSPEDSVVFKGVPELEGEDDILHKILTDNPAALPDFVFSDGGEYSGYPEWRLMKDVIPIGGIWASHDIYYPKSSKHCRSTEEVEKSSEWEVLEKTDSRQGLLIARRVANGG